MNNSQLRINNKSTNFNSSHLSLIYNFYKNSSKNYLKERRRYKLKSSKHLKCGTLMKIHINKSRKYREIRWWKKHWKRNKLRKSRLKWKRELYRCSSINEIWCRVNCLQRCQCLKLTGKMMSSVQSRTRMQLYLNDFNSQIISRIFEIIVEMNEKTN